MRVLVTGGAGYIGSHTVRALREGGNDVVVLDTLEYGHRAAVPDVPVAVGDVADVELVRSVVAKHGIEEVVHFAGYKAAGDSMLMPEKYFDNNVARTLRFFDALRQEGVTRLVFSSSCSVYGSPRALPVDEDHPTGPESPYGESKLMVEQMLRWFVQCHGMRSVALRYFNVYGPRQRPDATYAAVVPLFIDALLNGRDPEVHGDGLQSRDFTFISDVVAANLAAARASGPRCAGRVFNVAGGRSWTLLDVLGVLGELLDVRPHPQFLAPRAGDVRHSRADPTAAAANLDFHAAVGLDEGLRATVAWLRTLS